MKDSYEFEVICKNAIIKYVNDNLDITDGKKINIKDVYVVWMCKTLQNSKALLSTNLFDGMYYECTYNGEKNELYLDAYKKWDNKCISENDFDTFVEVQDELLQDRITQQELKNKRLIDNWNELEEWLNTEWKKPFNAVYVSDVVKKMGEINNVKDS